MEHICRCSQCGGRFKVDAKHAGRRVKCPKCGEVTVVPVESSADGQVFPPNEPTVEPGSEIRTNRPSAPTASAPPVLSPPSSRFQNPPSASQDDAVTAPDLSELQDLVQKTTAPPPNSFTFKQPSKPARSNGSAAVRPNQVTPSIPSPVRPPEPTNSGGIKINVEGAERPAVVATGARTSRPQKSKSNPLAKVIVAGIVGLILVVGAIVLLVAWYSSHGSTSIAVGGPATLVMKWPESDRKNSALTIDGKRQSFPATGPIEIALPAGQHKLLLQRRGYEMVEFGFSLKPGENFPYEPEWKAMGLTAVDPRPGRGSAGTPSEPTNQTDPPAPAGGPVGFGGWLQSLEGAERLAKKQRKDIFMVFAGSDWSQASMDMAENILSNPEFRRFAESRFVLLVIDLPRTEAGFNQLENSAQNRELYEKFLIRQVPTVVLLDSEGRPYAIDGAFDETTEKYLQRINRMASYHGVRNDLFAATSSSAKQPDDQRLKQAHRAVTWLRENHLLRYYLPELNSWYRLASSLDSQNEQGQLEVFFEADWLVRLANAVVDRKSAPVKQQLADLLTWSGKHKFTDPDRGVRLHLAAFQLLAGMRDEQGAARHIELAGVYSPTDANLQKELNDARRAVASSNQLSSGTAFVVDASGYLLTNYHVIEGPGNNVVRIPGKKDTVFAEVIDRDEQRDMALLKIDPTPFGQLKPLPLTIGNVKRASSVAVFGFPLGDDIGRDIRITTGVVSALPDQSEERMLLLDCRVNPGNSGGPVLQRDGRVVGMITAKTSGGVGVESYGMALPTSDLVDFLGRHLKSYQPDSAPAGGNREWEQIDEQVTDGNSVLMVLKLRK